MKDITNEIMNIPQNKEKSGQAILASILNSTDTKERIRYGYILGHKDIRHEASEMCIPYQKYKEEMQSYITFLANCNPKDQVEFTNEELAKKLNKMYMEVFGEKAVLGYRE